MATTTATRKIDVDSHFYPRIDQAELKDLLPKGMLAEAKDMLWRDAVRFVDPRGVRATIEKEASSPHLPSSARYSVSARLPTPGEAAADPLRDPEERVKALGQLGFDMQVLLPDGIFAFRPYGNSPSGGDLPLEIRLALCRLYNNAASAAQKRFPGQLIGVAIVPFDDIELSCEELRRAVSELGLHGVVIPGNWMGKNFDAIELYPFWKTVNDLDITCMVHHLPMGCRAEPVIDHTAHYPIIGMERMRRLHIATYVGFGLEYVMACTALTLGGVLDEFLNLRFCFFEAGGSWLLYAMYGADRSFLIEPQCARTATLPSDLMRKHCFTAIEPMEHVAELVAAIGSENFFFGTDFPHPEYEAFQGTAAAIETREGLSPQDKANILGGNITRLLKI
ncbi:MAG TPA: amidohydrolase family protein [Dehalococcoidia bacterium]|nr:amidohydrolase family protein [Dehalococcoidia bacterium]